LYLLFILLYFCFRITIPTSSFRPSVSAPEFLQLVRSLTSFSSTFDRTLPTVPESTAFLQLTTPLFSPSHSTVRQIFLRSLNTSQGSQTPIRTAANTSSSSFLLTVSSPISRPPSTPSFEPQRSPCRSSSSGSATRTSRPWRSSIRTSNFSEPEVTLPLATSFSLSSSGSLFAGTPGIRKCWPKKFSMKSQINSSSG